MAGRPAKHAKAPTTSPTRSRLRRPSAIHTTIPTGSAKKLDSKAATRNGLNAPDGSHPALAHTTAANVAIANADSRDEQ